MICLIIYYQIHYFTLGCVFVSAINRASVYHDAANGFSFGCSPSTRDKNRETFIHTALSPPPLNNCQVVFKNTDAKPNKKEKEKKCDWFLVVKFDLGKSDTCFSN